MWINGWETGNCLPVCLLWSHSDCWSSHSASPSRSISEKMSCKDGGVKGQRLHRYQLICRYDPWGSISDDVNEMCRYYIMGAQADKPCWTTGSSLAPSSHPFLLVPPAGHFPALHPPPPPLLQRTLLWKTQIMRKMKTWISEPLISEGMKCRDVFGHNSRLLLLWCFLLQLFLPLLHLFHVIVV